MPQIQMKPEPIGNKQIGWVHITTEQILKQAEIHRVSTIKPVPHIMDQKELLVYKQEKRKQFEDKLRRQRYNVGLWVRYAQWEDNLKQYQRARSVMERALEIDYSNKSLWLKYAEMEMKNKFVNHARNVYQRACYYLPREDQFWFKYAYMEELIGEYVKAREIFDRWMEWCPGEKAWTAYIKFEERMGQSNRAKNILYRYLEAYPTLATYLKVAKAELKARNKEAARRIYERAITQLGQMAMDERYFCQFARFQIKQRQNDRARQIYQFGLRHLPKEKSVKLYRENLSFQKQHGTKADIDEVILGERRNHYKTLLATNQTNYDAWLNLARLDEAISPIDRVREVYQAAILCLPPAEEKRFWRRYIYLWYGYAVFQEEVASSPERAAQIFQRAIKVIPHKRFTFGKLWIYYANLCIRCCDLDKARRVYGRSIGLHPKKNIIRAYIQLEQQLCNMDRVRKLYEKFCEKFASQPTPWIQFAGFEAGVEQYERARQILGIGQQMGVEGLPDAEDFIDGYVKAKEQEMEGGQMQEEDNQSRVSENRDDSDGELEEEEADAKQRGCQDVQEVDQEDICEEDNMGEKGEDQ